jgi:hypothetical protein
VIVAIAVVVDKIFEPIQLHCKSTWTIGWEKEEETKNKNKHVNSSLFGN